MSQPLANADGVPLFACTKCNSRHPFEDLSQGHQLCKNCKGSFQVIKCSYCRSEFQQETSSKSNPICKKCEQLQAQHGRPGPCAYCNIIAAFIGTKCQRCTNSEKKYGPPMSCEHCRQKCAFDRKDPESKKKVDGKILCWLCTMAYKRTLAKARQREAILKSSSYSSHHHRSSGSDQKSYSTSSRSRTSSNHKTGHRHDSKSEKSSSNTNPNRGSSLNDPGYTNKKARIDSNSSSYRHSQQNSSLSNHRESSLQNPVYNKLAILDSMASSSSSANGHPSSNLPPTSEPRFADPNASDMVAQIAQLKETVAQLNKRLQMKEKELLSKDQQIADLKSTSTREYRELREKMSAMQKQHTERISDLQAKLVTMQKQIASQTKVSKPAPNYLEPPMVI